MASLRIWIILSWIALPTVMFGGYSLLRLLNRGDALTPFQVDCFRAGHAHAGVLLLLMKDAFYEGELWKNELESITMPMLESYDVILCETSPGYVCDGPRSESE